MNCLNNHYFISDDTITIGRSKLNVIYDPSHLIKGIRNNFLTKDIKYKDKISRWQDIVDVYKTDCNHTETRLLHKLNDEHIIPDKIKKMKVCIFCQFINFFLDNLLYSSDHRLTGHDPQN